MHNSRKKTFSDIYANDATELDRVVWMTRVKQPELFTVNGNEGLGVVENVNLYLKEFSRKVDNRMAAMSKSVHPVDFKSVEKTVKDNNILFVKHGHKEILTPEGFQKGIGSMAAHVKGLTQGVFIINGLKVEANRLYHWLKQIIKTGRIDQSYQWSISDFDEAVTLADGFVKDLPTQDRRLTYSLHEVYLNFGEFFELGHSFNNAVKTIGPRDIELTVKELKEVYNLGTLLISKLKAGDIKVSETTIADIESVIQRFVKVTDLCGVLMILINEMTQVFESQAETISSLGKK